MVIRIPDSRHALGSYTELDDRLLVLDFQAGHPEAFVEIHHRYEGLARHVCLRYLGNPQDADEAFQETWIRVFQGLHRFNGRYALQPWIARIATNVSLDVIRTRGRRPLLDDEPIDEHERADASGGPEEAVERLVERDLVLSVLSDLPDAHRRALVLRELEGRSHREIAADLGISPPQAKALIHRAKGSFRRRWLKAATERHGMFGVFLIPLFWASKLGAMARRMVDRAGEVAQTGASEVLAHATASPAVPAAATGFGEKVVAAGLTLLVAGGVTVGAATIGRDRAERQREVAEIAAPAVAPPTTAPEVADRGSATISEQDPKGEDGRTEVAPIVVLPSPTESPSPETSPTESPSPETSPTESPSPETSPTESPSPEPPPIPPAPRWTGSFAIDWPSQDDCGCGPGVDLVAANVSGRLEDESSHVEFWQRLSGAARDGEGDSAWALQAELGGTLGAKDGSLALSFTLGRASDRFTYAGSVGSATVNGYVGDGDPIVYTFSGSWRLTDGNPELSPIPTSGAFSVQVGLWADGETIHLTQVLVRR